MFQIQQLSDPSSTMMVIADDRSQAVPLSKKGGARA